LSTIRVSAFVLSIDPPRQRTTTEFAARLNKNREPHVRAVDDHVRKISEALADAIVKQVVDKLASSSGFRAEHVRH
jgi:hypothetical protein